MKFTASLLAVLAIVAAFATANQCLDGGTQCSGLPKKYSTESFKYSLRRRCCPGIARTGWKTYKCPGVNCEIRCEFRRPTRDAGSSDQVVMVDA